METAKKNGRKLDSVFLDEKERKERKISLSERKKEKGKKKKKMGGK